MRGTAGVVRNLGALTVAQVLSQLLNLAALVYLARALGDHWFGVVQVGVAVSAYALITAEWGMMSLGIREVARLDAPADVRSYGRVHQGILAALAAVVLGAGVAVLPAFPFYREDPGLFLLYLALVVPQVAAQEWLAIGLERMHWVGTARTLTSAAYAAAVLFLLRPLDGAGGWPAWRWVPLFYLASFCLGQILLAWPVRRWVGGFMLPRFGRPDEWRRRLGESAPIGASIVTMRVLMNGDIILLGLLARPEVAGQYAAPAKIGFLLVIAMEVMWKALLPRLSRLAAESPAAFRGRFRLYFGLVFAALAPVAVGGVLVGTDLMSLVYGPQYAGSGPIFRILAVSYSLLALGWFLGNSLLAADRQREFFPPLLAGAATVVAVGWLVIPGRGALGAALTMLTAHTLLFLVLAVLCRSWFNRSLWPAVAASGVGLAALLVVLGAARGLPVLPRIALGGLAYAGAAAWPLRRWVRALADG